MNSRACDVDWQTPTRRRSPSNRAGDSHDVLVLAGVETGFGSTRRDWAAEETNHPREVVEAALAHTVRDKVEAAYARSDLFERRRRLMNDWSAYLDRSSRTERLPVAVSA